MRLQNLASTLARALSVVLVLLAFVAVAPSAFAKPQDKCPVMGGDIDKSVFADYKGERVYFCCPGCIGKFNAEPEKYVAKLKADGVELDKTPADAAAVAPAAAAKDCACEQGKPCTCGADCKCAKADGAHACGPDCACHKADGAKGGCQKAADSAKGGCQMAADGAKGCGCGK